MTVGDEDLIGRLRALHHEETARASRDLARLAAWTSKPTMRSSMSPVLAIGVAVVIVGIVASLAFFSGGFGIGSTSVASASPPNSTPSPFAPHAEDLQGPFRLAFDVPKATWTSDEAIVGIATLALVKGSSVELSGSAGLLHGFEFTEVNGSRHVGPVWTLECGAYRLESGKPITKPITKSGGYTPDQPDADFYREFLKDPVVRLPAGDWTITAIAEFTEGPGCSGQRYTMRATNLVHVMPAPAAAATPVSDGPEALIADLSAAGGTVLQAGAFSATPPFAVPGVRLCVQGRQVRVYVFPDARQREVATSQVDPDDPSYVSPGMIADWVGQPRMWQRDRILVMYHGDLAATEELLTSVLGPPFARSQGRTMVGRPIDTC